MSALVQKRTWDCRSLMSALPPKREWFSGDTYIFAYAPDGTVVLNPAFPAREGHAPRRKRQKGEGFSRRDHKDRADKRIGMGRLLATEAWTNRTVAEVELPPLLVQVSFPSDGFERSQKQRP
jgi:hypothetical protein